MSPFPTGNAGSTGIIIATRNTGSPGSTGATGNTGPTASVGVTNAIGNTRPTGTGSTRVMGPPFILSNNVVGINTVIADLDITKLLVGLTGDVSGVM